MKENSPTLTYRTRAALHNAGNKPKPDPAARYLGTLSLECVCLSVCVYTVFRVCDGGDLRAYSVPFTSIHTHAPTYPNNMLHTTCNFTAISHIQ